MFRQVDNRPAVYSTVTSCRCVCMSAPYTQHRQLRMRGNGSQHEPHCGGMLHRVCVSAAFHEHHVCYLRMEDILVVCICHCSVLGSRQPTLSSRC